MTERGALVDGVDGYTAEHLLRTMILSRCIEDRVHSLYKLSRLKGRVISGRGQEAVSVGSASALAPGDVVAPVHRDLGVHLVRGTDPLTVMLHYFGRAAGPSQGRDGDIHFGEWSRGVFPMVSHLPDSWPVMAGAALAFRLRGESRVAMALCGDGATSTGLWHETLNFSSVFSAPAVFIVENNQYAYSTPTARQFRLERISDRASAYGIPGETVDGNDVLAVHNVVSEAVSRAREGGGPTLVEAVTMRMDGHAIHDDAAYVPREILASWADRDPIDLLIEKLTVAGVPSDSIEDAWLSAREQVDAAVELAEAGAMPDPVDLTRGVLHE